MSETQETTASNADALVDSNTLMVRIGSDIVDQDISDAPRSIRLRAGIPEKDLIL